jgi:OPA family sugar phosphate sensor protein UhpC-like MFS transporter
MIYLVGLAGSMMLYSVAAPHGTAANVLSLGLVGFCLFGPESILSGAAAQDLGGPAAAATAAGIINGAGSIGAVLQGPVIAPLEKSIGWSAVFDLIGVGAFIAALVLVPFWIRERRR